MKVNPTVSIITPSFNRADIIHETAESIFTQSYPHWEWMIVDDGSTDNSWELIRGYAERDARVRVFQRDREPKGAATCRNIAVQKSTGDYLLFLDTDDLLASFCLQQRVGAMQQQSEMDFIFFPMLLFKQRPDDLKLLWNIDKPDDDIDRILLGDAISQGTGTLWKKQSFLDIGMWDEQLLLWQDVELHLRSMLEPLRHAKRMDLPPDVFHRVSEVSVSRTGFHSLPKFRSRVRVLEKTLERAALRGIVDKHRAGLRQMFADILSNAAISGYQSEIPSLLALNGRYRLIEEQLGYKLARYRFLRGMRLYKLPFIRPMADAALRFVPGRPESSLGRILYTGIIKT